MDEPNPIKDLLYKTLDSIPNNIKRISDDSKSLIKEIFTNSNIDSLEGDKTENYEKFAESLMHYLLTNALIPSQRKIAPAETELDVVIPDIRTMRTSSRDVIILVFPKTDNKKSIENRLEKINIIQPNKENIWLIQKSSFDLPYKTYEIVGTGSFANILDDVKNFMIGKTQSKFKIFKV